MVEETAEGSEGLPEANWQWSCRPQLAADPPEETKYFPR
jgi:hypothetical protein